MLQPCSIAASWSTNINLPNYMENKADIAPPKTIDEYLYPFPENVQLALNDLRQHIHTQVPDLQETIAYMVPVFKYKGHSLVGFAAFKKHCSFFVMSSPSNMPQFEAELQGFKHAGSTIHFQVDKPLPATLIDNILRFRVMENEARFGKKTKTK